jgi:hypothetical protein
MSKKYEQRNYMNKDFANRDIIKDDLISIYTEEQDQYNSDNFNNGLELDEDMEFRWSGNENTKLQIEEDYIPPEDETKNEHKNDETNSFYNFDDDKNTLPFKFFDFSTFNGNEFQLPPLENININISFPPDQPRIGEKFSLINKKRGRISKECENIKGEHTKNATDNIERRIKNYFYDSTLDSANEKIKIYNQSQNGDGVYPQLKDIDSQIKKQSSKNENEKLLDNTVKDMLCEKISSKYKKFPEDYNKKIIDKIYQEGKAEEVINFLNQKVLLLYNRFIEDDKERGNFKPLTYYIERMKEKEKDDYLETIISTAKNFEVNIRQKKSRNRKKKKQN